MIKKGKVNLQNKKVLANHVSDKGLVSRIYKEILQLVKAQILQF